MINVKTSAQDLDILKELRLIHHQIDNIDTKKEIKVRNLKLSKVNIINPTTPKNIKERFRIAVNEFRQKIDIERKIMHSKIA